jgi:hypothetical protein
VTRFLAGLGLAAAASGITWGLSHSGLWTAVAGIAGALVVWVGPPAIEFAADVIDDHL